MGHLDNTAEKVASAENALVLTETIGRVGLITLNRPQQMNALNDQLMDELGAALLAFDADDAIGAIVLTGNERAFAAGADISAMQPYGFVDAYSKGLISRNWETMRTIRKPVLKGLRATPGRFCSTRKTSPPVPAT